MPFIIAAAGSAAVSIVASCGALATTRPYPHRQHLRLPHREDDDQGPTQGSNPRFGGNPGQPGRDGYVINRQGFGNYVSGPDGSFGGYPLNSPGAQILQRQQEKKCQNVPESC